MDSNQILPNDKDFQVLGDLKMLPTNPRWQTAAIFKNRKIAISLQLFDQF